MLVGKLSICNLSQALKCIDFFFDNIVLAVKSSELVAFLPNTFYCIASVFETENALYFRVYPKEL